MVDIHHFKGVNSLLVALTHNAYLDNGTSTGLTFDTPIITFICTFFNDYFNYGSGN